MNKILLTILVTVMLAVSVMAQDAIRYQGVAFDQDGNAILSSDISLLMTVVENDPNGNFTYIEAHDVTTGDEGQFEVEIGRGTPVIGDFSDVNWLSTAHYLQVAVDPNGGTDYLEAGTTEFLSVPYAMHATVAQYGPTGSQGPQGPSGPAGPQGATGEAGIPGLSLIHI